MTAVDIARCSFCGGTKGRYMLRAAHDRGTPAVCICEVCIARANAQIAKMARERSKKEVKG